jgi:AbrB family looped-hinge helix DNA binding protein
MWKCWRWYNFLQLRFDKGVVKMEALTTISSKYQIVIPREVREKFNLKPGQKVMFIPYQKSIRLVIVPTIKEGGLVFARPFQGEDRNPRGWVRCRAVERGFGLHVVPRKRGSVGGGGSQADPVGDVRLAEAQLTYYVTEIEKHQSFRPFGFLANGLEIHFVDVGIAHKREVFGFFTREDLENLLYIRQNAKPLSSLKSTTKSLTVPISTKPFACGRSLCHTVASAKP